MTQPRLDFARDVVMLPTDTHVTQPDEVRRLTGHNERILARLQAGPCTNAELAKISLKYTSRLSELKNKYGHDIRIVRRDYKSGLCIYEYFGTKK